MSDLHFGPDSPFGEDPRGEGPEGFTPDDNPFASLPDGSPMKEMLAGVLIVKFLDDLRVVAGRSMMLADITQDPLVGIAANTLLNLNVAINRTLDCLKQTGGEKTKVSETALGAWNDLLCKFVKEQGGTVEGEDELSKDDIESGIAELEKYVNGEEDGE